MRKMDIYAAEIMNGPRGYSSPESMSIAQYSADSLRALQKVTIPQTQYNPLVDGIVAKLFGEKDPLYAPPEVEKAMAEYNRSLDGSKKLKEETFSLLPSDLGRVVNNACGHGRGGNCNFF